MKMLDNQRERDYWLQITYEYMTEESEDEEREYIRMHKLSWTSHSKKLACKYARVCVKSILTHSMVRKSCCCKGENFRKFWK